MDIPPRERGKTSQEIEETYERILPKGRHFNKETGFVDSENK